MPTSPVPTSQQAADIRVLWDFHVLDSGPVTADLILVLGSHDMRVADRAASLYRDEQAAPLVVVTGGAGKVTADQWSRSEGELYAERLQVEGVPSSVLLIEMKASNTGDNFEFSRTLIYDKGFDPKSGIIVSKPYMARRSLAVGEKKWPELTWYTRPPLIDLEDYPTNEVPFERMVNLMVGDLQRLKVYADKGFQAPVDIPKNVWQSYERLAESGYDKFVIT